MELSQCTGNLRRARKMTVLGGLLAFGLYRLLYQAKLFWQPGDCAQRLALSETLTSEAYSAGCSGRTCLAAGRRTRLTRPGLAGLRLRERYRDRDRGRFTAESQDHILACEVTAAPAG